MLIEDQLSGPESDFRNLKKMRFGLSSLFFEKHFILGLAGLIVQQAIVAASIYFLASAAGSIDDVEKFSTYFGLYVVSLVTPYLPGLLSHYYFDLWVLFSTKKFQDFSWKNHPYKPTDFVKSEAGSERNTLFSNTAPSVISDFGYYVLDLISTFLNSLFSIAVIVAVLDYRIAISYCMSLFGCALYTYYFSDVANEKSENAELARVSLLAHAEKLWPNLSLGNSTSLISWVRLFDERFGVYVSKFRFDRKMRYASALLLSLISVVPTALTVMWVALQSKHDLVLLAAMLVSAPRIFQLLTMLGQFSSLIFGWSHVKGRLSALEEFFSPIEGKGPTVTLNAVELTRGGTEIGFKDVDQFISKISIAKVGRFSLRGKNGSGKTTLLLRLKTALGSEAYFLPPSSQLIFDFPASSYSTGQRKLAEIEALVADQSNRYLLLDEWDGNLDANNVAKINSLIDAVSKERVVVEIRHRH